MIPVIALSIQLVPYIIYALIILPLRSTLAADTTCNATSAPSWDPGCPWLCHCLGDPCIDFTDCSSPWPCINNVCTYCVGDCLVEYQRTASRITNRMSTSSTIQSTANLNSPTTGTKLPTSSVQSYSTPTTLSSKSGTAGSPSVSSSARLADASGTHASTLVSSSTSALPPGPTGGGKENDTLNKSALIASIVGSIAAVLSLVLGVMLARRKMREKKLSNEDGPIKMRS